MKVLDPGHQFLLNSLDGGEPQILTFVKRCDPPEKYPGNADAYPGTNIQEVLRALIARLGYLQGQNPCNENVDALGLLSAVLYGMERRAHRLHGHRLAKTNSEVLAAEPCPTCGHTFCSWCP